MSVADDRYEGVLVRIFAYFEEHRVERPTAAITAESHLIRDLGLDSLQSFEMVAELEDHFDVTIPLDLFQSAETLGDVARGVVAALRASRSSGPGRIEAV
jgi:acyl carrier protein